MIYRALRPPEGKRVILKLLKEDFPSPEELTRYRREYEITRSLNQRGIIKTYGQEKYQKSLVMFLEDFGAVSLKILIGETRLKIADFIDYGIKICDALGEIHRQDIIHKDINPSNIVINTETGRVKIIDFGVATRLSHENRSVSNPTTLEGTPAYIAPEQTGRMNCALDYRADFYSLGATFYELLCGRPPFEGDDPLELIHCHLVKEPPAPHLVDARIPEILSRMVMRLLAKRPEDRYQSAAGIAADLRICRERWPEEGGSLDFKLGSKDLSGRFEIPSKLYGRKEEIRQLLKTFEQIGSSGPELVLVGGYSGIGKTVLIQELYKPITQKRAFYISGKYDQLQRNIPYSAFTIAFRELVRYLLSEPDAALAVWRDKILGAVGNNGQVIVDVIPEIALVIGSQAPVPELGPLESQNRFNLTFANFLGVFCREDHPLVIFLDDLQWIDNSSMDLLSVILADKSLERLLLIGAYRDNEVDRLHPLMVSRVEWEKKGVPIREMSLAPLDLTEVTRLVAETLAQEPDAVTDLAGLIYKKTGGNPFFTCQFLLSLHEERLVFFPAQIPAMLRPGNGTWRRSGPRGLLKMSSTWLWANSEKCPQQPSACCNWRPASGTASAWRHWLPYPR
ncbi:MAG: AAA family ATPase [Acidobacteriota bacterium]|nr:AAA family ATPase [Acidobacteriota bacterium]